MIPSTLKVRPSLITGALLLGSLFHVCPSVLVSAQSLPVRVVGVSDGDSLTVHRDGKGEKVRLYGVDSPEKKQDFGLQAKQFTSQLAFGKDVELRFHSVDRYGRTVAEVILPDGRNLNHELVRSGYAWWYERFAPDDAELKRLQDEAREKKRGLWSHPVPVPPWEFRRPGPTKPTGVSLKN